MSIELSEEEIFLIKEKREKEEHARKREEEEKKKDDELQPLKDAIAASKVFKDEKITRMYKQEDKIVAVVGDSRITLRSDGTFEVEDTSTELSKYGSSLDNVQYPEMKEIQDLKVGDAYIETFYDPDGYSYMRIRFVRSIDFIELTKKSIINTENGEHKQIFAIINNNLAMLIPMTKNEKGDLVSSTNCIKWDAHGTYVFGKEARELLKNPNSYSSRNSTRLSVFDMKLNYYDYHR